MFADDMLVKNAVAKIDDGDVILTYGYSSTVFAIFMQAQQVRSLWHALSVWLADGRSFTMSPVQYLSSVIIIIMSEVSMEAAASCSVSALVCTGALAVS